MREIKKVLDNGFCIGCGVCTAAENTMKESPIAMELNSAGSYQARIIATDRNESSSRADKVCPFSDSAPNEDFLADKRFSGIVKNYQKRIGFFDKIYAGYVAEGDYRNRASSGGTISWMIDQLFINNEIDFVVHVKPSEDNGPVILKYQISSCEEDAKKRSKSSYYPVELSEVLKFVKDNPGRYAVVGIPCFIKAINSLRHLDTIFEEKIVFTIGLICGHLKSTRYADFLAMNAGVQPGSLTEIDFRTKIEGNNVNDYGITAKGKSIDGELVERTVLNRDIFGASWGYGLFMPKSCEYCDDVFAETADMVVGDAWMPEFLNDSKGANVVLVRNPVMAKIIHEARLNKQLSFREISTDELLATQDGCMRQRGEALAFRLYGESKAGRWVPKKRVEKSISGLNRKLRVKYGIRQKLTLESKEISQRLDRDKVTLGLYKKAFKPLMNRYDKQDRPLWRRIASKIKWRLIALRSFVKVLKAE